MQPVERGMLRLLIGFSSSAVFCQSSSAVFSPPEPSRHQQLPPLGPSRQQQLQHEPSRQQQLQHKPSGQQQLPPEPSGQQQIPRGPSAQQQLRRQQQGSELWWWQPWWYGQSWTVQWCLSTRLQYGCCVSTGSWPELLYGPYW